MTDPRFGDALQRGWDAIRHDETPPLALDAELVETIRAVQARDHVPAPDAPFMHRLREELLAAAPLSRISGEPDRGSLDGRSAFGPFESVWLAPSRAARSRPGVFTQFATAALVLLVLAGVILAFGPGRRGQRPLAPTAVPAIGGTPAAEASATPAEFLWETGGGPDAPFEDKPHAATVAPDGTLWVLDAPRHQFQIFAPDGTYLESWGTPGSEPGEFNFPSRAEANRTAVDVAFDRDGSFYVSDPGNFRIQKFGPDRSFLAAWGSEGDGDGQFLWPGQIEIDDQGRVYVLDGDRTDVQVFDREGTFLSAIGGRGFDDGEFDIPIGLALDSRGVVWITDYGRHRVQGFAPEGELLSAWGDDGPAGDLLFDPGELQGVGGLAIDAQDRFFITDFVGERVQIFAPDGTYLTSWGHSGSAPGEFHTVSGVIVDGQGNAYVSDYGNERIQTFHLAPPFDSAAGSPTE